MGKKQSIRSKAVHFVSDLTTVILNPISDKPYKPSPPKSSPSLSEDECTEAKEVGEAEPKPKSESSSEEGEGKEEKPDEGLVDGPDTSSFSAFLYSLLASDQNSEEKSEREKPNPNPNPPPMRENSGGRRGLLSKGKQTLGRAFSHATRIGGFRSHDRKAEPDPRIDDVAAVRVEKIETAAGAEEDGDVPGASEPSLLMSENTRHALYASLPALVQGRKWMLLYSTWRHGISLSTLYRRSMLWPGLSLLVVGDRKGATFGGLIEAPLNPTNKKRYQGSNATFVFTDKPGHPCIFHPTGANRYFTLCSLDFLAIGGGGHFALYLDNDLLNGSSSVSETYGNPCLANSEDFEVKEVELWGFVYPSKYEEILAQSRIEMPGICRW